MKKQIVFALLLFTCSILPLAGNYRPVEAASFGKQLLYAAAATAMVNQYYANLDANGQSEMLRSCQKKTGVYQDEKSAGRVAAVVAKMKSSGAVRHDYAVYVNPQEDMNAFNTLGHVISINRGALEKTDDDELAALIAHEMGHGECAHSVKGVTKMVSLALAVDIYLSSNANNASYILGAVADNYINNEVITMEQEWEADNYGFDYAAKAGYNPGGCGALMVKMRSLYGELHKEGLARVVNPNNHPKMSDRINNFSARLTAYANGRVVVKDENKVLLDGKVLLAPVKTESYLSAERAFLIAGNLARACRQGKLAAAYAAEDGSVYVGNLRIMTPVAGDITAEALVEKINAGR